MKVSETIHDDDDSVVRVYINKTNDTFTIQRDWTVNGVPYFNETDPNPIVDIFSGTYMLLTESDREYVDSIISKRKR